MTASRWSRPGASSCCAAADPARRKREMRNWHEVHLARQGAGDRIADRVASFIGSWTFIIGQAGIMAVWVVVNSLALFGVIRFDEYPFVFLNLFMSAEAAFAT